jgi:hypothetical protein
MKDDNISIVIFWCVISTTINFMFLRTKWNSRFSGGEHEDKDFLGCDTVQSGRYELTFQRNLLPPSPARCWRQQISQNRCHPYHPWGFFLYPHCVTVFLHTFRNLDCLKTTCLFLLDLSRAVHFCIQHSSLVMYPTCVSRYSTCIDFLFSIASTNIFWISPWNSSSSQTFLIQNS